MQITKSITTVCEASMADTIFLSTITHCVHLLIYICMRLAVGRW